MTENVILFPVRRDVSELGFRLPDGWSILSLCAESDDDEWLVACFQARKLNESKLAALCCDQMIDLEVLRQARFPESVLSYHEDLCRDSVELESLYLDGPRTA